MKYSLRKSFSSRRRKETGDDDQIQARNDHRTGSNSNLVKATQSKSFLRRRRRYSTSPPRSPSPAKTAANTSKHPYNNHVNDDDDDDDDDDRNDPFSSSPNVQTRARPFDKITDQIRKSFRNTLTRQRCRIESNNSNKRLILNTNDENQPVDALISTGLTSQTILPTDTSSATELDQIKAPPKRRKAPLAPTHMNHSRSVPNPDCSAFSIIEPQESGYLSSSIDPQSNLVNKKKTFNQTFRLQISLLFKKRHAKQQQQQQHLDDDLDHQQYDDQDEIDPKKQTLGQRFDTIRRSLHLGNRHVRSKGKGYLLSND